MIDPNFLGLFLNRGPDMLSFYSTYWYTGVNSPLQPLDAGQNLVPHCSHQTSSYCWTFVPIIDDGPPFRSTHPHIKTTIRDTTNDTINDTIYDCITCFTYQEIAIDIQTKAHETQIFERLQVWHRTPVAPHVRNLWVAALVGWMGQPWK